MTKRKNITMRGTVSLDGLSLKDALKGLLSIPEPDAAKPKHAKAKHKKVPPTGEG